jgi:predicted DNA-binding protein (MmcQ/YjbR family)
MHDMSVTTCKKVRDFCLGLPGVVEDQKPGQVTYRIGQRPFIVIETFRDTVGASFNCIAFKASFFDHEHLSSTAGFYPAPYLGGAGWLGCRLDDKPHEVDRLTAVLSRSHRQIAGRPNALRRHPEAMAETGA